jgi:RNA-binding protein Tab2/Atab2
MATIWELDFYSRPILDENKKKIWEVLICESPQGTDSDPDATFRYAKFCSNSEVNSVWLKAALTEAIAQAPAPPDRIRFFRQAMNNMIVKACDEAGIPAQLSRRTLALNQWLPQRFADVYPTLDGFQPGNNPSVSFAKTKPQPLPDALRGEKWQFVTLAAQAFDDLGEWAIAFGESFPLRLSGLSPESLIPGLIIYSGRATPLAAWMSGLDLAELKFDAEIAPRLYLETGIADRWILATLPNPTLQAEAQQFEAAKQRTNGVHFIAVQTDPKTEAFAGFWLLQAITLA